MHNIAPPSSFVRLTGTLFFAILLARSSLGLATGTLSISDTPSNSATGTYSNIDISASDGSAKAALPAFAIDVIQLGSKSTTLSWVAPTENSDGSALTNLAGYHICYGTRKEDLSHIITVRSVGITTYVISNLSAGRYYFAIRAYNKAGVHSSLSNIVTTIL